MNLFKVKVWPYMVVSLGLLFLMPIFHPSFRVLFLLPCLVVLCYQRPFIFCLWASFLCGILLDILSSERFMGLYVTSYCGAVALLYPQKRHFFADNVSTLPILTFICSIFVSCIQLLLIYIFQKSVLLNWAWFTTNMLFMPVFDAIFAFVIFLLPKMLFGKPRRRGNDYFMHHTNIE